MQDLPVPIAIVGFTVMGVGAIAMPALVTGQFGILELTPAGRQGAHRFLQAQGWAESVPAANPHGGNERALPGPTAPLELAYHPITRHRLHQPRGKA